MKKLTVFHVTIAGIVFFALALLDSVLRQATGFNDLSHIGKTFVILFLVCLVYPVVGLVKKIFK